MELSNTLPEVKEQYEMLPYPPRNPEDESGRLITSEGLRLDQISHYCFRGENVFHDSFQCLVAGGGTGDCAIYLAEQLKDTNAKIYYLDISSNSRKIAEQRANKRGLKNITWITDSLLNLPTLGTPKFDFIEFSGVLHHLAEPEKGLQSLKNTLNENGAMCLMLYAKYGRQSIYNMQELLRNVIPNGTPINEKIQWTRKIISCLPKSNSFSIEFAHWANEISENGVGDAGLYDLLLHSQDQSYTVDDIYKLAKKTGLNFVDFIGDSKAYYEPRNIINEPDLVQHISKMSKQKNQSIAEQLVGKIIKHTFYLSNQTNAEALLTDVNNALILSGDLANMGTQISEKITPGEDLTISQKNAENKIEFTIKGTKLNKQLFKLMDGKSTISDIIIETKKQLPSLSEKEITFDIEQIYKILQPRGWLYLTKPDSKSTDH